MSRNMKDESDQHRSKKKKFNEVTLSTVTHDDHHTLPSLDSSSFTYFPKEFLDKLILSSLFATPTSFSVPLYPLTFIPTMSITDYVTRYSSVYDFVPATEEKMAGLIINKHTLSESSFTYQLHCLEYEAKAQIQVIAHARNSYMDDAEFSRFHSCLEPGVFLGVSGLLPGKSENGDLAIIPSSFTLLTREAKNKLPLDPDRDLCFNCKETVSLEDYREMIMDKGVASIVKLRHKIVDYITSILEGHTLFKRERPSMTECRTALSRANVFRTRLFNSPSLVIWKHKMSCARKTYEMAKKIRKEGIDMSQIPKLIEFELKVDFDYDDLMLLTERILSGMVKRLTGGYKAKCYSNGLHMDPIEIDFKPPFSKIDIMEELDKLENLEKPEHFSGDATNRYLAGACTKYGIEFSPVQPNEELLDKVVKHFLEKCVNPTFILYHPNIVSLPRKCGLTQHFELFVNKHEVSNGCVALDNQLSRIQRISHIKDRQLTEDEEIALEYGLLSTGGWSLGMDRLTLLLTDAKSIKEKVPTSKGVNC